jgi:hypothetical protein
MALQNWRLIMDHVFFDLHGTLQLPKWYNVIAEVVHCSCRNGTLSLPKTGTLLLADHILSLLRQYEDEGSTIKSFCQDHDIGRSTFTRWNRIYGHPKKKSAAREKFVPIEIPTSSSSVEGTLFAEVGGIKLYQRVEASYLKELKSS